MQDRPPFVTSAALAGADAAHGFFSRLGGVSTGPFESLNTGPGSSDAPEAVAENRARCARAIGADPRHLTTLHQIHSATVVTAPFNGARPEADGVVSNRPGLALGVLTADCMPFLFIDPQSRVIAAAHAGWRGALCGVLGATVDAMCALGARPDQIIAGVGPCLRQPNFEVGIDLLSAFTDKHPQSEEFFKPGVNSEKRQFDLVGFGIWRLAQVGVTRTDDAAICTLADNERYFSYRAARRSGHADYGRNLSLIMLPE